MTDSYFGGPNIGLPDRNISFPAVSRHDYPHIHVFVLYSPFHSHLAQKSSIFSFLTYPFCPTFTLSPPPSTKIFRFFLPHRHFCPIFTLSLPLSTKIFRFFLPHRHFCPTHILLTFCSAKLFILSPNFVLYENICFVIVQNNILIIFKPFKIFFFCTTSSQSPIHSTNILTDIRAYHINNKGGL